MVIFLFIRCFHSFDLRNYAMRTSPKGRFSNTRKESVDGDGKLAYLSIVTPRRKEACGILLYKKKRYHTRYFPSCGSRFPRAISAGPPGVNRGARDVVLEVVANIKVADMTEEEDHHHSGET